MATIGLLWYNICRLINLKKCMVSQNNTIPQHIAIIPDGNRRWAKSHHVPSLEGHKRGLAVGQKIARKLWQMGVHTVTVWAFSTENWNRDGKEVSYLMKLYERFMDAHMHELEKERVRVIFIGRRDRIPQSMQKKMAAIELKTTQYADHVMNIAIDYGGRDEIVRAAKALADKVQAGTIAISEIDEGVFAKLLDTGDQPYTNPDIIIRTSGEQRTSGLMPWQAAYAEYFFLPKFFPDVTEADMEEVLREFTQRQRRFGA